MSILILSRRRTFILLLLAVLPLFFPPLQLPGQTPGRTSGSFTFFAVGDAGEPGPLLTTTAEAMRRETEELQNKGERLNTLIFLGDNFYPNGLNLEQKERNERIATVLGPYIPLLNRLGQPNVHAIAGNHDYYCAMLGPVPYGTCFAGNEYERLIAEWTYYSGFPASVRYPVSSGSADSVELIFFDSAILLRTELSTWKPWLDSLETLLARSGGNRSVKWRLFFAHHSPYSVGAHGGYRKWDPERREVLYTGNCIADGDDPFKYVQQFAEYHEDVCAPRYQAYKDSLFAIISRTGVTVQAMFAGHDHTLQLLNHAERQGTPRIFIVSGAGSKQEPVRSPLPPEIYTHPFNDWENKGKSAGGFTAGRIEGERLHLWFVNGESGEQLDMGGTSDFFIDRNGLLVGAR